jgi:hypothetical protein
MDIRILMTCDTNTSADAEMLKDKGFQVYTCEQSILSEMIDEIHPDVIFINPEHKDVMSTTAYNNLYNNLLDNVHFASYPVIYTLSEDDVYIVNRKRTASKDKRTVIADNVIDGIKTALINNTPQRRINIRSTKVPSTYYANRA